MSSLIAAGKPGRPVVCNSCHYEFPQDPCFEVSCPECGAGQERYCKRPSEPSGPFVPFHAARDLEALKQGFYDHTGNSQCGPNSKSEKAMRILRDAGLKDKGSKKEAHPEQDNQRAQLSLTYD